MDHIISVSTQHHYILPGVKIFFAFLDPFIPHLRNRFGDTLVDPPSKNIALDESRTTNIFIPFKKSDPFPVLAVLSRNEKIILILSPFTAELIDDCERF